MIPSNTLSDNSIRCGFEPCSLCNTFDQVTYDDMWKEVFPKSCNKKHYVSNSPEDYSHFLIQGKWYSVSSKYTMSLVSLVPIDMALYVQGALVKPYPVKIRNLTDLFALIRRCGVTAEQMKEVFPPEQVRRMNGRVLGKLVKG